MAVNPGDRIPADGELLEAINLSINEAILTGESEPVAKMVGDSTFMGTTAFAGRGLCIVSNTGLNTELGKIATSFAQIQDEVTPLQFALKILEKH